MAGKVVARTVALGREEAGQWLRCALVYLENALALDFWDAWLFEEGQAVAARDILLGVTEVLEHPERDRES